MCFVLPAMVIWGTNWCWCTDTDQELHLSYTGGVTTLHAQNLFILAIFTLILKYVACVVVGGFTSSKCGHWVLIGVGVLSLTRNCTSVLTDGVNTWHAGIH